MAGILERLMDAGERTLLVGPPGCAKTGRIHAAAAASGRDLIVSRASLAERTDYAGCLVPDHAAGITHALPLAQLKQLRETTRPTLFFLDDLGQAPMDVQASLMALFDDGALSDSVLIWGATNRPGDKAGVSALCEPLRSRFACAFAVATPDAKEAGPNGAVMLSTWADEVAGWCAWAMQAGVSSDVVAYHRFTSGEHLYEWQPCADPGVRMPDFRSWHTVGRLWGAGVRDTTTLAGAIGWPAASAFVAFAACASGLPSPASIIAQPDSAIVPEEPSALWLVSCALAAHVTAKDAKALVTYADRMPRLYGALCVRDAYKRLGAALATNQSWVAWFLKNQELFSDAA